MSCGWSRRVQFDAADESAGSAGSAESLQHPESTKRWAELPFGGIKLASKWSVVAFGWAEFAFGWAKFALGRTTGSAEFDSIAVEFAGLVRSIRR